MKKLTVALTAVAGFALHSVAFAGLVAPIPVTITSNSAHGSVDTARYSSDNKQRISCYTLSASSTSQIGCVASDKNNNSLSCYYPSPTAAALSAVASINKATDIYFAVDTSGRCSYLLIQNSSSNIH